MALFNAVRRYINPGSNEEYSNAEKEIKHDGIVVVGDGNTRECMGPLLFIVYDFLRWSAVGGG